jgi:hypothetical protein
MPDKYAYRASKELAAALNDYDQACRVFQHEVIDPWEAAHPEVNSLWVIHFVDTVVVGFSDLGGDVPEGLSRAKNRQELLPKRGASGQPWRDALTLLGKRPRLSTVFRKFGIDTTILCVDQGRRYTAGLAATPLGTFIFWGMEHPNPGEHLTPVPLSVFYTAREALDAQKAQVSDETS